MAVYFGKNRYEVFFNKAAYLLRVPRVIYIELKKYVGIKFRRKSKMSQAPTEDLSAIDTFTSKNEATFSCTEVENSQISINSKFGTSVLARLNGYLKVSPIHLSQIFISTKKLCQTATGFVLQLTKKVTTGSKFLLAQVKTFIIKNIHPFGVNVFAAISHANANRLKGRNIQYVDSFQKAVVADITSVTSVKKAQQGHYAKMAYWIETELDDDDILVIRQAYNVTQNNSVLEVE